MTIPRSPLEIICSARAARHLRVKAGRALSPSPAHAITQWRVDTADDCDGGRWFLVTNLSTLYTFLITRKPASRFNSLVGDFQLRLGFALLDATPPLEWRPSEVVPVKGNPRAVVGSMNEMAKTVSWPRPSGGIGPYKDLESFLQRTPYSAIGDKGNYGFPDKVWLQRLNELTGSGVTGP